MDLQDSITELNVISEQMQIAIAENSRVALDQDEYEKRYAELTERYERQKLSMMTSQSRLKARRRRENCSKGSFGLWRSRTA